MASKAKWFCVGTSGKSIEGRDIKPEWLMQAAKSYSPEVYGARINVEHYRAFYPGSEFAGYGDVLELKAEESGDQVKLFALIEPTEKLIALNKKSEKVYTSMELYTNFAETQSAYLVGLAITDSPASLGTSRLQFTARPPENFISEYIQMDPTENPVVDTPAATQSLNTAKTTEEVAATGLFTALFAKFGLGNGSQAKEQDQSQSFAQMKEELNQSAQIIGAIAENYDEMETKFTDMSREHEALKKEFSEFKKKVEGAPVTGTRQPHAGAEEYTPKW